MGRHYKRISQPEIVITGATGAIGSKLLKSLSAEKAIGTSRKNSSSDSVIKVGNFDDIPSASILIHLSEESSSLNANKLKSKHVEESTSITKKLIDIGFDKIIYASSSLVYSDSSELIRKTDEVLEPYDYYSEAKLINEETILSVSGLIARISNVVNSKATSGVVHDIVLGFQESDEILLNDTYPVRDFISAEDVISCLIKMVKENHSGIYNVGSGTGTEIYALAEKVAKIMGIDNPKILSRQSESKKKSKIVLDISNTIRDFVWSTSENLSVCLRNLIENKL